MEKFISLRRVEGEPPHIVTGVKNNKVPYGAIGGGNGTFVVKGTPSLFKLNYQSEDGKVKSIDITRIVKETNNWKNLTENRKEKLEEKLEKMEEFDISKLSEILKV